jgi:hypothetical protein
MEKDQLPEIYRSPERRNREIKYGLTVQQKYWIKEAYAEIMGEVMCVFPVVDRKTGETRMCGESKVEIHHIVPQGWCKRILGIDPNFPENTAPLCAEHHRVGQKDRPLDREHQDCVHVDAAWAQKNYGGKEHPTSYDKVFEQRKKLTDKEIEYWNPKWDEYFLGISIEVMKQFKEKYPDYPFPERS